jgi:WD40 repeat protein
VTMPTGRYRFTVLQLLLVTAWIGIVLASRVASHQAFRRVAGYCRSVAFSPDGRTLAAGITNQLPPHFEVRLWDMEAAEPNGSLTQHDYVVWSLAFSPDGKTLAAACVELADGHIVLWDLTTRRVRRILKGHKGGAYAVAFGPDTQTLAVGAGDGSVKVWDASTGELQSTIAAHKAPLEALAISPDGKVLATASRSGRVKLWDILTGQSLVTLNGHTGSVDAVAFAPDGKTLATGSSDRTVKLWNTATYRELATLRSHRSGVEGVAFSPDGRTLASGSMDSSVKLWDVNTMKERATLGRPESNTFAFVSSVAFSPDGRTLAAGCYDQHVKLWDVATGRQLPIRMDNAVQMPWTVFALAFAIWVPGWIWVSSRGAARDARRNRKHQFILVAGASIAQLVALSIGVGVIVATSRDNVIYSISGVLRNSFAYLVVAVPIALFTLGTVKRHWARGRRRLLAIVVPVLAAAIGFALVVSFDWESQSSARHLLTGGLRSDHVAYAISGLFFGAAWIWLLRRQSANHAA